MQDDEEDNQLTVAIDEALADLQPLEDKDTPSIALHPFVAAQRVGTTSRADAEGDNPKTTTTAKKNKAKTMKAHADSADSTDPQTTTTGKKKVKTMKAHADSTDPYTTATAKKNKAKTTTPNAHSNNKGARTTAPSKIRSKGAQTTTTPSSKVVHTTNQPVWISSEQFDPFQDDHQKDDHASTKAQRRRKRRRRGRRNSTNPNLSTTHNSTTNTTTHNNQFTLIGQSLNVSRVIHHNLSALYTRYLHHRRTEPMHLLEIGLGPGCEVKGLPVGASMELWRQYLVHATLHVIEIHKQCLGEFNTTTLRGGTVYVGDQADAAFLSTVCCCC